MCEHARGCSQNAEMSQLTAEAKLSVLERRLEAGEKEVRNGVCVQEVQIFVVVAIRTPNSQLLPLDVQ